MNTALFIAATPLATVAGIALSSVAFRLNQRSKYRRWTRKIEGL